jgi:hypothetical protein
MISAMGLFVIGYYWGNQYKYARNDPPVIEGVLVRPALELPDFELADATGRPFSSEDLSEHWTMFAFGELSEARGHLAATRMIDVYNRLADQRDLRGRMQLALASETQSPNLARDFSRLSPALRVLSGEAGEVGRLRALLGEDTAGESEGATVHLFGPSGRLTALFTPTQPAESIAADLVALSERPQDLYTESTNE